MSISRRKFLQQGALATAAGLTAPLWLARSGQSAPTAPHSASGPFQPSWDSLSQYQTPEWFRDAKFGIWAHWGPQCVPEEGDWYGRFMYMQGERDYNYHVKTYGHPSKFGMKDIDHLWRGENWDPQHLIGLYQRAGAKYFMAMANHHDNLDMYNSKYQPWNTVAIGPKKDIIGGWEKVVRPTGLHFGVSVHAAHAWSWYEVAQGSDKTGPLAGVPYDGKLTKADGKGLWWEGLDPQDLYAQNHTPGKGLVWDWQADQGSSIPDAAYCEKLYNRTTDLIDKYHPDMIYFDDTVLPLYPISDVGLRLASYFYNANMKRHNGRLEAVITGKGLSELQRQCMVWDIERGTSDRIEPLPWQADTCIGQWHYDRNVFLQHQYKTPELVAHTLIDIVSKNGNLMLNIPLPGHGAPDTDELAFLEKFTIWMHLNGEAIHGTRPWHIYGEGPAAEASSQPKVGNFNEGHKKAYTSQDIRFTQKKDVLYAFAMAWPEEATLTIKSLAIGAPHAAGEIRRIELLGMGEPLTYVRDANGLTIKLPRQHPGDYAYAFKISGTGLTKVS